MVNINTGYKETDIGIIPEDWNLENLGSILGYEQPTKYLVESTDYIEHGDTAVLTANKSFILGFTNEKHGIYNNFPVIIFDDFTTKSKFVDFPFKVKSSAIKILQTNDNAADLKFSFEAMQMIKFHISDHKRYWISEFQNIKIPFPCLAEQKAIAAALSDVDSLIESLEQLIAKKRDMKTAAMQELLTGKKRLPGFDDEWQEKNMADDSYLKARIGWQGLTTSEYLDAGNYYLVTGTDFKNGKIDWNSCCYVEKERFEQDKNIQVKVNDILLTKDGTIGKAAYVDCLPGKATLNSGVFVIRPVNNNYNPLYFYYVLRSEIFTQFLNKLQAGSTINHLYQKDFVHFSFMAPSVPEQEAIATILYDLDIEINSYVEKLNKTKAIKTGMMQELLTGKTRLINANKKNQGVAA